MTPETAERTERETALKEGRFAFRDHPASLICGQMALFQARRCSSQRDNEVKA